MSKGKDFNYDNFKPKDKTSGGITLTPKTKEGPIGPRPPRSPRPRMTLTKLAEMFLEFRTEVRGFMEQTNKRLHKLEK